MGQADLSWPWRSPPSHQASMADRMVWRPEWPHLQQGLPCRQRVCNRIDACDFQSLRQRQPRQNRGQGARQQGFARAGNTNHQDIVAASTGNFKGTFGVFLPFYVLKVDRPRRRKGRAEWQCVRVTKDRLPPAQMVDQMAQAVNRIDLDLAHQSRFGSILGRHKKPTKTSLARHAGNRQHTVDMTHPAV